MSGRRAVISLQQILRAIGSALSPCRMARAKARTRRWAAASLSDSPGCTFGAANPSLISASAAIPTTIAAPRFTPATNMFCRRVDLRHRDQGDGIAGQHGAVRPVAIQKSTDIDAKPEPAREAQHEQLARLGEQSRYRERRDHPDDGAEDPRRPFDRPVPASAGRYADGHRSGRGALERQPERRVQRHHPPGSDPERESPGGERKPRDGRRTTDTFHESHG